MDITPSQFTAWLQQLSGDHKELVDQALPVVYRELHEIAERQLRRERVGHTLNATALIHEAYMRLVNQERVTWQNRAHFLAMASLAVKRILMNYAQTRGRKKRGGGQPLVTFQEELHQRDVRSEELLDLDAALQKLREHNARHADVIEYWFFGGLTHEEIAEVLSVSVPTVRRDWRLARAWLSAQLRDVPSLDGPAQSAQANADRR